MEGRTDHSSARLDNGWPLLESKLRYLIDLGAHMVCLYLVVDEAKGRTVCADDSGVGFSDISERLRTSTGLYKVSC